MYDILKVAPGKLPVSDAVKKRIVEEETEWQTKDLENSLSNLEITESGRLIEIIRDEYVDLDYHGILEFHNNVDKEWFSFLAKFTDGNLVDIVIIKERIKYTFPPIPLNSYFKNEKTNFK